MNNINRFFVCVDGSHQSKECFMLANELMNNDDHIVISHISDDRLSDLSEDMKPEFIKDHYTTECLSRFGSDKYQIYIQEKDNGQYDDKRQQLLHLIDEFRSDIAVVGYHGRKGRKLNASIMGKTAHHSVYNSQVPLVICKDLVLRTDNQPSGFNFCLLLDGSRKSYKTFEFIKKVARKEDQVVILTCLIRDQKNRELQIKQKYNQFIKENLDINSFYHKIEPKGDKEKAIIDYINMNEKIEYDFIVFGNNGNRAEEENKHFIGRLAEVIITKCKANPIMLP